MPRTNKIVMMMLAISTMMLADEHESVAENTNTSSNKKPMIKTPLTRTELVAALRDGHVAKFGVEPSENRLAMAWAQVAFENGQGKHTYNHNLGNISPWKPDHARYLSPDKHYYRDFDTFVEGAEAYWHNISKCTGAIAKFDTGTTADSAASLKKCGYFEADLNTYTNGLSSLFRYAIKNVLSEEKHEREERNKEAIEATRNAAATLDAILDTGSN